MVPERYYQNGENGNREGCMAAIAKTLITRPTRHRITSNNLEQTLKVTKIVKDGRIDGQN